MSRRKQKQISPIEFFRALRWIDKRPLLDVIEDYRRRIFEQALFTFDEDGRPRFNLALMGRAKKNFKSADLILAALYRLLAWHSEGGNQCYCLANDEGQAADDLELAKKLIRANPVLAEAVRIKQKLIERKDGQGFLEILPAQDVAGSHGKTYLFAGFDEIHEYRTWDLLEAMQLDPTRPDAMMWITSYASIYHKPGVPLFDMFKAGKEGQDPRMFFSWYAADYTTDPDFENTLPEDRANPSKKSWGDSKYLAQQQRRLPAHKFRRLHLNLPGLPEGSAYTAEKIMEAVERGVKVRPPVEGTEYCGFVDMSGGSSDDATLGIAHKDAEGRAILDVIMDQGQRPPFDPRRAVERFAAVLKEYGVFNVTGDKYAGETFIKDFEREGIAYRISDLTRSQLYEALEPKLNSGAVVFLDEPQLETQFLGLCWRGGKIDHPAGEHDDYCNAAAGAVYAACEEAGSFDLESFDRPAQDNPFIQLGEGGGREPTLAEAVDRLQDRGGRDDPFSAW
ncbi:MAG: hypothetical protein HYY81_07430 [Deltaproteobacteria bacterium]|nr:hypothetical protein [Deltaproteobacteria bacterium]